VCILGSSYACDICSAYSRIRPNDYDHTIGIHYTLRGLEGELPSGLKHLGHLNGLYSTDLLEESFYTLELRGRYRFSNRLALLGIMPFKTNIRTQNGQIREVGSGIGDPSSFLEYRPFLPKSDRSVKFMTNLRAGVKFPLGNTQKMYKEEYLDYDFQLGSGSYDFLFGSESYVGLEHLGLAVSQLYKLNTPNLSEFEFGDSYNAMAMLDYRWNSKKVSLSVSSGIQVEKQWMDEEEQIEYLGTDKLVYSAVFRSDVTINNLEFYGMYAKPFSQTVNSLIVLPSKNITQLGMNYLIKIK